MASHYAKIPPVTDRHRHKAITPRPPEELRERAQAAVAEVGSTMNAHVIAFLKWLVNDTDQLPERPPRRTG